MAMARWRRSGRSVSPLQNSVSFVLIPHPSEATLLSFIPPAVCFVRIKRERKNRCEREKRKRIFLFKIRPLELHAAERSGRYHTGTTDISGIEEWK
jgi:hypothetical protein